MFQEILSKIQDKKRVLCGLYVQVKEQGKGNNLRIHYFQDNKAEPLQSYRRDYDSLFLI